MRKHFFIVLFLVLTTASYAQLEEIENVRKTSSVVTTDDGNGVFVYQDKATKSVKLFEIDKSLNEAFCYKFPHEYYEYRSVLDFKVFKTYYFVLFSVKYHNQVELVVLDKEGGMTSKLIDVYSEHLKKRIRLSKSSLSDAVYLYTEHIAHGKHGYSLTQFNTKLDSALVKTRTNSVLKDMHADNGLLYLIENDLNHLKRDHALIKVSESDFTQKAWISLQDETSIINPLQLFIDGDNIDIVGAYYDVLKNKKIKDVGGLALMKINKAHVSKLNKTPWSKMDITDDENTVEAYMYSDKQTMYFHKVVRENNKYIVLTQTFMKDIPGHVNHELVSEGIGFNQVVGDKTPVGYVLRDFYVFWLDAEGNYLKGNILKKQNRFVSDLAISIDVQKINDEGKLLRYIYDDSENARIEMGVLTIDNEGISNYQLDLSGQLNSNYIRDIDDLDVIYAASNDGFSYFIFDKDDHVIYFTRNSYK